MSEDFEEEEGEAPEVEDKPKRSGKKRSSRAAKSGKKDEALEAKRGEKPLHLTEEQEKEYNKLKGEEKKKFEIRQKILENRYLQKGESHEISLEDERLVNAAGPVPGPSS